MKKYSKIISLIVAMVIMVTMFAGCGEIKKAEKTVNSAFTALKTLNFENASEYMDIDELIKSEDEENGALSLDSQVILEPLFSKLEYEIISSEKIDKNTVIVKTKITAIDMKPVLNEFIKKAFEYAFANAFLSPQPSEEETDAKMIEMFVECVSKEDLAMVTNEIDIKVVKVDKKWRIEPADELSNALLGGLVKAAEEISNSFNSVE